MARGGVKDIGLKAKAKAKDTKKSEAKVRIALPRTDPLEAKNRNARGQGQGPRTQRGTDLKKKTKKRSLLQKFVNFSKKNSGVLKKKVFAPKI